MIYLDHNATTDPLPEVVAAFTSALLNTWANPSSTHRLGQEARRAIELARQHAADLISPSKGISAKQVTFLSSGTEAIDLAIRGALPSRLAAGRPIFLTTRVEHAAVREIASAIADQKASPGTIAEYLPLRDDHSGVIDLEAIDRQGLISDRVGLVSVQWANNETGAIQPIEALAARCRAAGAWLHIDATQWVGKLPAEVCDATTREPWCDMLTFAPHKFHGVPGVGILFTRRGINLRPQILGTQEGGRRGGTENTPAIIASGIACQMAGAFVKDADALSKHSQMRDRFEHSLQQIASELGIRTLIIAQAAPHGRLWNTSNIAFESLESEALLLACSERGVCASAGAACASGSLEPSPVLAAMKIDERFAHGAIRFSFSRFTTQSQLDAALPLIRQALQRVAGSSAAITAAAKAPQP